MTGEYEVLCDVATEVRTYRFDDIEEAKVEAERVSKKYKANVRVVRVIGTFVSETRWVPNCRPGCEGC